MSNVSSRATLTDPWEKLGVTTVNIGSVPTILRIANACKSKRTVCLIGETGIGKTPIVHQWAVEQGGECVPFSFAHHSREDLSMVMFNNDGTSFDNIPAEWLMRLNQAAEEKGLAVFFIDEWNRGDKDMVNAMFTLTDERRINNMKLHDNVLVVAAMNPSGGSYMVNEAERDHAVRKRLCFVYVMPDVADFLKHASDSNWHKDVISFVRSSPKDFYDRGARDAGKAFPCPANWEKISDFLLAAEAEKIPLSSPELEAMIIGQVGNTTGKKFSEFIQNNDNLIRPEEVLNKYGTKSSVRRRVLRLLNQKLNKNGDIALYKTGAQKGQPIPYKKGAQVRTDILSELMGGVTLTLFSEQPDPAKISECLVNFVADLPDDMLAAFAVDHLQNAVEKNGAEGERYFNSLTANMSKWERYRTRMKEITGVLQQYKKKIGKSGVDPLAD